MIQRIQTVYLLIVVGLLITAMCLPMGYFIDAMGEHPFKALGLEVNGAIQSTWGLFGILMVSTIVAVATIFLYKNRMLQIRMTIFNSLLLVGYYIAALAFYFALKNDENMFRIGWALCLPLVSIILNILAIRAIGRASVVPTFFGVNEPILFGAPIVLNPIFFVPFIFAPIVNVWIFKFFVDTLNMNSFSANLPWVTPGPLGIVLGTNFQVLSFILAGLLVVVDTIIYYPFVKVYDEQILEEERSGKTNDALKEKVAANFNTAKADAVLGKADVAKEDVAANNNITKETNVLVLCAGGGTSGLLANALNKAAAEYNVPVKAAAGGYGAHREMLPEFDLVILAPQVASNFDDMKAETDKLGIKLAKTEGAQYIKLTRDGQGALAFVQQQFD